MDALPKNVVFLLDIAATCFNTLNPNVRDFLTSEGFHPPPPRTPSKTNQHGNLRPPLVRNQSLNEDNKIVTIKATVQPAIRIRHPSTLMGTIGGTP